MAKKDNSEDDFLRMMEKMGEMLQQLTEEERDEMESILQGKTHLAELENERFYNYQKPDYGSKVSKDIKWLMPFWNAQNDDDKVMLCQFVESDIRMMGLTPQYQREEMRSYLYFLFDNFKPGTHENHWRLYGPLWMMERLKMTDCLDLVLEALRQDAYFFHNYFLHFLEWPSAVVYQLGKNQIDTLEQFIYEQGIIPDAKPIVFNALVWIYLRHPERRLKITAIILKFLNHCLDICLKGASPMNIEHYAIACATAHIKETLPLLRRLFSELNFPTMILDDGINELEQMMNDKKITYHCKYDNMNDYLYDEDEVYELDEFSWQFLGDDYDEEEESIYDKEEKEKRYTVRVELLDAPEKVERTLQVPSNIYLTAFTEVLMICFGRQDIPEHYEYDDGILRFLPDADEHALDKDYWEMDGTDYTTLSTLLQKKGDTATFKMMKGKKAVWCHQLTLEKSGRYTRNTENRITLLSGHGSYPAKTVKSMADHISRFNEGKVKKPNFDTIRQRLRDFEEENEEVF